MFEVVGDYIELMLHRLHADRIQETREGVLNDYRHEIDSLQPLARVEVQEFVAQVASMSPMVHPEILSTAVRAVINLERSRSGQSLLEKLARLSDEDVQGLNRLSSEWTVRDALTVLDEINRRMTTIEAIKVLSRDPRIDELAILHPLVTQARWLFGSEFDAPEYVFNSSIQNAAAQVFKQRAPSHAFDNVARRPDLVVLEDATISTGGTEEVDTDSTLVRTRSLLIVEVKRGESTIGRKEMNQAMGYVQDFMQCGHLPGLVQIRAYVVGHKLGEHAAQRHSAGEGDRFSGFATTYSVLVQTAQRRLFRLREKLERHYAGMSPGDLAGRATALAAPEQVTFQELLAAADDRARPELSASGPPVDNSSLI